MIKARNLATLLLAVSIATSVFVGCGSKKTSSTQEPEPKKLVQITALVHDRGAIPSIEGTLEDNWFTKWVNETAGKKIGVNVKFAPVPNAQREQVLATRLAAGDAPDICFTYDGNMLSNYTMNGGLTDLSALYEKYGKNLKQAIKPEILEQFKIDGKLTVIPAINCTIPDATFIRKDWLDKLGLQVPTNTDEFYNMLKQFKEKDPGKLGDKMMTFALQANFFIANEVMLPGFTKEAPTKEKLLQPWYFWPEAKELVRFMNKLYSEKLMGEFIVDKDTTQIKQKIIKGELGATVAFAHWPYYPGYGNILENLQKNIPDANLVATYPWKVPGTNENYYQFFRNGTNGLMRFFIPKSSKNAEAAFKYIDFMGSKEYIDTSSFGTVDGTDYKVVDGLKQLADDKAKLHVSWIQGAYYSSVGIYADNPQMYQKNYAQQFKTQYAEKFINESIFGEKDTRFGMPLLSAAKPASDKYSSNLDTKWNEFYSKLVLGSPKDFDKVWDAAMNTLKSEGGDEILKEISDLYKKQYGK